MSILNRAGLGSGRGTAPTLPQVNLLPPEIKAGQQLSRIKLLLGLVVVAVAVTAGLLVLVAMQRVDSAQDRYDTAQQQTATLLAEKAQYSRVTSVLLELSALDKARQMGTSTEFAWAPYTRAITAVAPQEISLDELTVESATPMAARSLPSDPLQTYTYAQVSFKARAAAQPDVTEWVRALESIPGFVYPRVTTIELTGDDDTIYYEVIASVQVTDALLLNRFAPSDEAEDEQEPHTTEGGEN